MPCTARSDWSASREQMTSYSKQSDYRFLHFLSPGAKIIPEDTIYKRARERLFRPNEFSRPMEEEVERDKRQPQSAVQSTSPPPTTATTTTSSTTAAAAATTKPQTEDGDKVTTATSGAKVEHRENPPNMGVHRSDLLGLVKAGGEGCSVGGGGGHVIQSPTTPRQPSKRDSGYHTDYSPATFTPTPTPTHFTFDSPESPTTTSPLLQMELPSPILEQGSEGELFHVPDPACSGYMTACSAPSSSGMAEYRAEGVVPSSSSREQQDARSRGEPALRGSSIGGILASTPKRSRHDLPKLPARSFSAADVEEEEEEAEDSDDEAGEEDDGDAFGSDVTRAVTSRWLESSPVSAASGRRREQGGGALNLTLEAWNLTSGGAETVGKKVLPACSSPEQQEEPESSPREDGAEEEREGGRSSEHGGGKEESSGDDDDDDDDEDGECEEEEEVEEGGMRGLASTAFHHGPLSVVRLPGGGRMRPLLARSTATQTPHLLCQLVRQVLTYPGPLPHSARGNVVRRLRSFSEGEEETVALMQGPLPDLVPVPPQVYHRERAYTCPDMETLHRQQETARAVGREIRGIADDFARNYEARRGQPHWAVAFFHAELNDVMVFVARGVRRLLRADFRACLRQQALRWIARHPPARHDPPDSPVDGQR